MTGARKLPALALLAMAGAAACEDRNATQVVISMATDLMAGNPLSRLSMSVERFEDEQRVYIPVDPDVTKEWDIAAPPIGFELPGTVVTYSGDEQTPKIRVTVIAQDPMGDRMLRRQSVFRLVKEKTLYLRMGITAKCFDDADCPAEKTCIEGRCREPDFQHLPEYQPAKRPELSAECDSGTLFRNTTTGAELQRLAAACPGDQICIESACYPGDVFGMPLPASQPLTVMLQVSDGNGAPVSGADIRVEDGPVSLVRRLRRAGLMAPPPPSGVMVMMTGPGLYQVQGRSDPLTTDIDLTVTAAGFAPQVVTVPFKPGVTQYQVPAVLSPLGEAMLVPGETQDLFPPGGGRPATLRVTALNAPVHVRFALLDGRYLPGQAIRAGAGGELLQAAAALYLENVGAGSFPANTHVALGNASTPPVFGAEGGASAYLLDLQGQWKQPGADGGSFQDTSDPRLLPRSGGFWAIANWTPRPACVRGRVLKPGGGACSRGAPAPAGTGRCHRCRLDRRRRQLLHQRRPAGGRHPDRGRHHPHHLRARRPGRRRPVQLDRRLHRHRRRHARLSRRLRSPAGAGVGPPPAGRFLHPHPGMRRPGLMPQGLLRGRELRPGHHDLDGELRFRPARAPHLDRARAQPSDAGDKGRGPPGRPAMHPGLHRHRAPGEHPAQRNARRLRGLGAELQCPRRRRRGDHRGVRGRPGAGDHARDGQCSRPENGQLAGGDLHVALITGNQIITARSTARSHV